MMSKEKMRIISFSVKGNKAEKENSYNSSLRENRKGLSYEERRADALASGAEEGRDKLR